MACGVVWLVGQGAAARSIKAVTTEFPPFQSEQDGRQWGFALTTAQELARLNGDTLEIEFLPWPRAYRLAEITPDIMIFCLARTPEREERFGWIGEVGPNDVALWKLASRTDIALKTVEDAKTYRLGVTAQDMKTAWLESQGFSVGSSLDINANDLTNIRMLYGGRIDLLPFSNASVLAYRAREAGFDPALLAVALPLSELSNRLYLAFSPGSDPARTKAYGETMQALRASGFIARQLKESLTYGN